jgi:hypothetical protein
MKYLKIFEAFDSYKLSKVFNYLNKESRSKFIDDLKSICEYIDYPISKISDEDFQYLPYNKAFKLNRPDANGLEIIKFWFDKDKNYITKSGITGKSLGSEQFISKDLDNYIIGEVIKLDNLHELNTGDAVLLHNGTYEGVGYVYRTFRDNQLFIIQDFADGSKISDWGDRFDHTHIGRYSWIISSSGDFHRIKRLHNKEKGEEIFNLVITIDSNNEIRYKGDREIIDANFALVLDITNLDDISLKNIKSTREVRKLGAFVSDDDIKLVNLNRYLNIIFTEDKIISNPDSIIKAYLTNEMFLFLFERYNISRKIREINRFYYNQLREDNTNNEIDMSSVITIKDNLIEFKKDINQTTNNIKDNIKNLKNILKKGELPQGALFKPEEYIEQLTKIEELSKIIYNKLRSNDIENLYDIESIESKLSTILYYIESDRNYFIDTRIINLFKGEFKSLLVNFFSSANRGVNSFNKIGYNRLLELIKRI